MHSACPETDDMLALTVYFSSSIYMHNKLRISFPGGLVRAEEINSYIYIESFQNGKPLENIRVHKVVSQYIH